MSMVTLLSNMDPSTFTDTEREIFQYFKDHYTSLPYKNLNHICDDLYVSNATIVRFCQKLGFNGFNEFKFKVKQELDSYNRDLFLSQNFINQTLAIYKDRLDAIDLHKIEAIKDIICLSPSLYIYGYGLSSIVAKYLQTVLISLDIPCILVEWQHLLEGISNNIDENSVLFIITAHPDKERYDSIFQKAKEKSAKTILITCEDNDPAISLADISLYSNDENIQYQGVDINPRIGLLTIIQILIELVNQEKHAQL